MSGSSKAAIITATAEIASATPEIARRTGVRRSRV